MAARTHQARCASSSAPVAPRGQGEARRVSGVPSSTGGGSGVRAAAAVRRPTGTCVPWLCTPFGSLARVSGTMAMSIGATTPLPKPRLQNPKAGTVLSQARRGHGGGATSPHRRTSARRRRPAAAGRAARRRRTPGRQRRPAAAPRAPSRRRAARTPRAGAAARGRRRGAREMSERPHGTPSAARGRCLITPNKQIDKATRRLETPTSAASGAFSARRRQSGFGPRAHANETQSESFASRPPQRESPKIGRKEPALSTVDALDARRACVVGSWRRGSAVDVCAFAPVVVRARCRWLRRRSGGPTALRDA